MTGSAPSLRNRGLAFRAIVVAAFSLATGVVVATRSSVDARPTWAPLAFAVGAAALLWAIDRYADRRVHRAPDTGGRWSRLGFYLMSASTVLGVANTWYAFLDPARNGWFSGLFLVGSALAAVAFFWLDPSRRPAQNSTVAERQ